MSNLENLRKQAKQILRWRRERHWPVAAQIREHLPAYANLSDREVLEAPFKLADAQELVARRAGFDSWQALKSGLPPPKACAEAPPQPLRLIEAIPFVYVTDVEDACAFWRDKLGFAVPLAYGAPPYYAEVSRDGVRVALRHVDEPLVEDAYRRQEELVSTSIYVSDAKSLFLEFQGAGVTFYRTLRTEPWGARGFIVEDPDGNLIAFGGPGE